MIKWKQNKLINILVIMDWIQRIITKKNSLILIIILFTIPIYSENEVCNSDTKIIFDLIKKSDLRSLKKNLTNKNLNCLNEEGESPLTYTLKLNSEEIYNHKNRFKILKLLLTHKANPNFKNSEGLAPIHHLIEYDDIISILKLFLKYKTDIQIKNKENQNLLFDLIISDVRDYDFKQKVINLFLKQKGDINSQDNSGNTILMHMLSHTKASKHDFSEMILYLYNKGINLNLKNKDNQTALDISKKNSYAKKNQHLTLEKLMNRKLKNPL